MTTLRPVLLALLLTPAVAFAGRRGQLQEPPPPPEPPTLQVQAAEVQHTPGSLWSEVSARQMVGLDGSARRVGDLITVVISDTTDTQMGASTATKRSSSTGANVDAVMALRLSAADGRGGGGINVSGGSTTQLDGTGSTSRNNTVTTTLTCEVVEVLGNGNLHVWGYKQVRVNREVQYVVLDGIARPRDIRMDNTVPSSLLAQSKIEITGSGVVADKQGAGLGQRIIDAIWPF